MRAASLQDGTRGYAAAATSCVGARERAAWACPSSGARTKRRLRRSRRARPNIWRFNILRRLICPSTGPLDQASHAGFDRGIVVAEPTRKASQSLQCTRARPLSPAIPVLGWRWRTRWVKSWRVDRLGNLGRLRVELASCWASASVRVSSRLRRATWPGGVKAGRQAPPPPAGSGAGPGGGGTPWPGGCG